MRDRRGPDGRWLGRRRSGPGAGPAAATGGDERRRLGRKLRGVTVSGMGLALPLGLLNRGEENEAERARAYCWALSTASACLSLAVVAAVEFPWNGTVC